MAAGVRYERRGAVGLLTLDREERRNALDLGMWDAFDEAIAEVERALPRAVVITGAGEKAFSAGMDVSPDNPQVAGLVDAVQKGDAEPVLDLLQRLRQVVDRFCALPIPTIAAVNGDAHGGGAELAARCDLRVMDPAARICFSEVKLGLMPDWGGGVALTRLLGPARAADLILTARKVGADEALALGLANRVSAAGASVEEAIALGDAIAANGPRAVRGALEIIRRTPDLPLAEALTLELDRAVHLIASGECVHGITAFFTRTPPAFPEIDGS